MSRPSALGVYAAVYFVFLYAPIILLPMFAFNDGTVIAFPLAGFTPRHFVQLAEEPALRRALMTSLKIATIAAVLSTLLGIFAARAGTRYRFPGKAPMLSLIMLPLVLPEVVIGASLLVVILGLGIQLSSWTIVLGHVLICTPFSVAILNGAFAALDPSLEEAARDLGETPAAAFRLVVLPLVMPGIVSSLLIAFIISLDEFMVAFFLAANEPTLPVYLWGMLRFPQKIPLVMALGTLLVVFAVVLLAAAEYMRRRGIARTGARDTGGFL